MLLVLPIILQDSGSYLPTNIPACLPTCFEHYLPTYLPVYLPTCLPTYLPYRVLPTCLPTNLPTYLPTYLPNSEKTIIILYNFLKPLLFTKLAIFVKFYFMLFNRDKYHTQYRKITRANDFPIFSNKKSEILKNFVCIFLLYYIIIICSILFGNIEPKDISFQEVKK